jgi:dTDP-4-amino-4,6-dideoxygalactose transaminase
MINVPFSHPPNCTDDLINISSSINNGEIVGNGPFTQKAEILIKEQIDSRGEILLTTSCTHALEIAAILLDIKPGDEIIVPSYTFVSTALAFYMHGAKIIFADITEDTLNIDVSKLEDLVTNRTRAIVIVHYGGVACEMDELLMLSLKHDIHIIEDNAHGLYGKYRDKYLGSMGSIATQSFHGTKNISCGEGGALILNNSNFIERAHIIREKGTNRSNFLKGKIDKYTWVDKGSSYVISDILAAMLYSQLNFADSIQFKRKQIWQTYNKELNKWAKNLGVILPHIPSYCSQAYHMFYLLFPDGTTRDNFIKFMAERNITVTSHYQPLHSSDFMQKITGNNQDYCPITTQISYCIVRLPLFFNMSDEQLEYVIEKVIGFEF